MGPTGSLNIIVALALSTLAFHAGATVLLLAIARAPGWARVRIVTMLAATAGLYSLVDLIATQRQYSASAIALATTLNVSVAAVHAAGWLWFTFSDEHGSWRSIPRGVRRLGIVSVALALAISLLGLVVTPGQVDRVHVPAFGIDFLQPRLSPLGTLSAAVILCTLIVSFLAFVRRARLGVPGARAMLAGFTIFLVCSIEEGLVSAGVLEFIYLAEIGYLALITPVTALLVRRFTSDARRLTHLTDRLADEVDRALGERDTAREALAAQERMAALGRLAGGIGHEVNNPLQYLTFSLEEIRDDRVAIRGPEGDEAITNAFEAVDRIRRVVDGLRAYSTPIRQSTEAVDLHEVVKAALRVATPQLRGIPIVRPILKPAPRVRGDEGKLVQAVVNAVLNAVHILRKHPPASAASISVTTHALASGDAEIEIRDNGPGFPEALLPTLGQPFVTTRATEGGSGLGIFVIRGIVDAHGGQVEFANAPDGGAVLRIRLPRLHDDQGTTAVASISTIAPGSISAETSTAVMAG